MTDELRAAIAFIVGNKDRFKRSIATRLYDHKRVKYIAYNLQKNSQEINMYDYDRGTYLSGNINYIYDYDTKTYFNVNYSGNNFSGINMSNNENFQGSVNENSIYIYDKETKEYYNYSIN